MIIRRPLPVLCVSVLLAATSFLGGCGGGGGSSSDTDNSGGGTISNTPPASTVASPCGASGRSSANYGSSVYLIDPSGSATLPAGATRVASFGNVPWSTLTAGATVLVAAGTYAQTVVISGTGTSAAPIVVQAADSANPPVITGSVDVSGASYVQISRLTVQMDASVATTADYPGFTIRDGSTDITVADSQVVNAFTGFDIISGTGHQIQCNTVQNSYANGLGLEVNATTADPTVVSYNTVTGSGTHGMELHASNYRIEHNIVSGSGRTASGASGIHIYANDSSDDAGAGNIVRYNYSYGNHDTQASDGNGIQIDQWCDGNWVAFNVAWGNDGAGISVFDADNNTVVANSLYGNGQDSGGTHASLGELIVSGSQAGFASGRPSGNQVYDNLAVATRAAVPAFYVSDAAYYYRSSSTFGPNLLFNTAGSAVTVMRWSDSINLTTASQIDLATGNGGNLVKLPAFYDISNPLANGLWLTANPGSTGTAISGYSDMLGQAGGSGWSYFGAYFTAP